MEAFDLDNIAQDVLDNLRANATNIVTGIPLTSPRAIGDAVQSYLGEEGLNTVLSNFGIDVRSEFSRRAMEDMAFMDSNGNYYAVDVKTHNTGTEFNMPNLISVRKLANFYQNDDKNNFCILIVSYKVVDGKITYEDCSLKRIECFDWSCLTLGALGWGQIQIANAYKLEFCSADENLRKNWMLKLCDKLFTFYDEEILKISERKNWFSTIKTYWEAK